MQSFLKQYDFRESKVTLPIIHEYAMCCTHTTVSSVIFDNDVWKINSNKLIGLWAEPCLLLPDADPLVGTVITKLSSDPEHIIVGPFTNMV